MTELQGYGADTWCLDSLRPGRFARGATLVAQAAYRRLITPRGALQEADAGAYGFDVAAYLGAIGTDVALRSLPGLVRAQLKQDDRVQEVDVSANVVTDTDGTVSITMTISASLVDSAETFTLTLAVSDVTVSILGVAA